MFVQTAGLFFREAEQPKLSFAIFENPAPQPPQCISPENRNLGRRRSQTGTPVSFDVRAP